MDSSKGGSRISTAGLVGPAKPGRFSGNDTSFTILSPRRINQD